MIQLNTQLKVTCLYLGSLIRHTAFGKIPFIGERGEEEKSSFPLLAIRQWGVFCIVGMYNMVWRLSLGLKN